jgi:hypothetical protein
MLLPGRNCGFSRGIQGTIKEFMLNSLDSYSDFTKFRGND